MTRRTRAAVLPLAMVLVAGLAACGSSGGDPGEESTADGPVTVTMWGRSDNAAFLPDLVEAYNASQDEVDVELTLVPAEQVTQKFSAAAAGGASPDLVSLDIATVPQYATAGWLQDVTADAEALGYLAQLSPSHLELATLGERLFALPFTADVSVLYYNKALFEQAGLDPEAPPATWPEIREAARAVAAIDDDTSGYYFSGACAGCMAFTLLPYVWAEGGDVLTGQEPEVMATLAGNAALESTLEHFRGLWEDGVVDAQGTTDSGADQFGPFFSGTAGMFVNGSYPYGTLTTEHPDIDFGLAVVPSQDGSGAGAYTGGDSIAVTTGATHSEAAWEAVVWFTSQGQEALAQSGVLPTRLDIAEDVYVAADDRLAVFVEALRVGSTPSSTNVAPLFFDNNGPWGALMQSAIFDGEAEAALSTAQDEMDSILGN